MNAIILAAGMGTRLSPVTNDTAKPLLLIKGKRIIETQLDFLSDAGVKDIIIVTGAHEEQFKQIVSARRDVHLLFNEKYQECNNFTSMLLALNHFTGNTFVLDGDTYLHPGFSRFLPVPLERSTYFTGYRARNTNEWSPVVDASGRVREIQVISQPGHVLTGVSWWSARDATIIREKMVAMHQELPETWVHRYWDDVPRTFIELLDVVTALVEPDSWMEIDTIDDYNAANAGHFRRTT